MKSYNTINQQKNMGSIYSNKIKVKFMYYVYSGLYDSRMTSPLFLYKIATEERRYLHPINCLRSFKEYNAMCILPILMLLLRLFILFAEGC